MPEALAHYRAAARLRPDDAEIQCDFGTAYLTAGRMPEAHNNLGTALRRSGRPNEATAEYRTASAQARLRGRAAEFGVVVVRAEGFTESGGGAVVALSGSL